MSGLGFGAISEAPISSLGGVVAVLTGTAISGGVLESEIDAGGETIIIELIGDTWVAAGTGPIGSTADTQAIIDGFTAASSPAGGWNNEVRDKEVTTAVVRTSDTVCTITLTDAGDYDISADETITATIPAAALVTSGVAVVAAPTFDVTAAGGANPHNPFSFPFTGAFAGPFA